MVAKPSFPAGDVRAPPKSGASDEAMGSAAWAPPVPGLPKGGGAIGGIGETFRHNAATGTASLTIPFAVPAGRRGFGPTIALTYDSGSGNGPWGLGWRYGQPDIVRRVDKRLPVYDDAVDSDVFLFGGEELVPVEAGSRLRGFEHPTQEREGFRIRTYRPRKEGGFSRIQYWQSIEGAGSHWRVISRENVTTTLGETPDARVADPADPSRIFRWLPSRSWDCYGNAMEFAHGRDRPAPRRGRAVSDCYPKLIRYANTTPFDGSGAWPAAWHFAVVFDYGDHDEARPTVEPGGPAPERPDPFSSFRAGFEIRTRRLCRRILLFHRFDELGPEPVLTRALLFGYAENPVASRLTRVEAAAFLRDERGGYDAVCGRTGARVSPALAPPLDLSYQPLDIGTRVQVIDPQRDGGPPGGVGDLRRPWVDLDGEGLPGILSEQRGSWIYYRNESRDGRARFAPGCLLADLPSVADLGGGRQVLEDLAGDGRLCLVQFRGPVAGYQRREPFSGWDRFVPFDAVPTIDFTDPNLQFIDCDGDGRRDILLSGDDGFLFYRSLGPEGFAPPLRIPKPADEGPGPALLFADGTQSLHLADMTGDGLADLVRVRNGAVSYWPNLGFGRFAPQIDMADAPRFDHPDFFDQARLRLADIDGSGPTDIVYLGRCGAQLYFNQAGNGWSGRHPVPRFPDFCPPETVSVVDLLGSGTCCLVWSSPLPDDAGREVRFIDLTSGRKPYLLTGIRNNLGAETHLTYGTSTRFYVEDRLAGRPWVTRLPFPVHVLVGIEKRDCIGGSRLHSRHAYHHGFYDGVERDFCGFGLVESWDAEEIGSLDGAGRRSPVPPVLTRSWFHTGADPDGRPLAEAFAASYWHEPGGQGAVGPAMRLPPWTGTDQRREALRALRGAMLRQEVYALDGSEAELRPYRVTSTGYTVRELQAPAPGRRGIYMSHAYDSWSAVYERRLVDGRCDPRAVRELVLAVDEFGTVLDKVAIAYARRHPDPSAPEWVRAEQGRTHVVQTASRTTDAVDGRDAWRTPVVCAHATWELGGLAVLARPAASWAEVGAAVHDLAEGGCDVAFEAEPGPAIRWRRLLSRSRNRFRSDDLASLLPLGTLEARALPGRATTLALTPGLVGSVYGDRVGPGDLAAAGYEEEEDGWWAPSAEVFYDGEPLPPAEALPLAARHFFQPRRLRDPFGNETVVRYDASDLMVVDHRDAAGNHVTAGTRDGEGVHSAIDYRVLAARLVTDANGNRTAAAFDVEGRLVATAVMGKAHERLGDTLDGLQPDIPADALPALFAAPIRHAADLLAGASNRVVYDSWAYRRSRDEPAPQPPRVWTMTRETHVADLAPDQSSRIAQSFAYSDGFGRVIQSKARAEPAPATPDEPRWIASGWTVFDAKNRPIRTYEPFFTATPRFEADRTEGVGSIALYDPLDRPVATVHPDRSYDKQVFGPWRSDSWDRNDTVLLDITRDPDVAGYVDGLPPSDLTPSWYAARIDGDLGGRERDAARKTAAHAATPGTTYPDSLGRTIAALARNRTVEEGGDPRPEAYLTRTVLDIVGNTIAVVDAQDRTVVRTVYDLGNRPIRVAGMDNGVRRTLLDVTGVAVLAWDSRGHRVRSVFDRLRRPVETWVGTRAGAEILAVRTVYGEGERDAEALNLRGRVARGYDDSGVVASEAYDFKGNLLGASRRHCADWRQDPDWSREPGLEADRYDTASRYDAMNRVVQLVPPHAREAPADCIQFAYDRTGLMRRCDVWERIARPHGLLPADTARLHAIERVDYNAKAQRLCVVNGNGVRTRYRYDPLTFRLRRLQTLRGTEPLLDLAYTLDPIGNVSAIEDRAQQTAYFRNHVVEASASYVYDALYRLCTATGREHLGQGGAAEPYGPHDGTRAGLPEPGDGAAMGRYVERYHYDSVGNLLSLRHTGEDRAHRGWTRHYAYAEPSGLEPARAGNRLSATTVGEAEGAFAYDRHGNMTRAPHLALMAWNWRDRLRCSAPRGEEDAPAERTFYVYAANGERRRKVTERPDGTRRRETLYLGGVEIDRQFGPDGTTLKRERDTLDVMSGADRIVRIERRVRGKAPGPERLARFQYGNLLGSAVLELDDGGRILSYEEYYSYGSTACQAVDRHLEVPKRIRFAGRERDEETGFYSYPARYYAPWLGRWISCDPAGLADGPNLYQFARSNPVVNVDPNGTDSNAAPLVCTDPTLPTAAEEKTQSSLRSAHPAEEPEPFGPPAPPPKADDAVASGPSIDVTPPEVVRKETVSKFLTLDLPPDQIPADVREEYPNTVNVYSVLQGFKQTIYSPIKAWALDERPRYLDSRGHVQTSSIHPDRSDAIVGFGNLASFFIPGPAEEVAAESLMAGGARTTNSLESGITVNYGKTFTSVGDDAMTQRVAEAIKPWPGVHDVVVHAEAGGGRLSPGVSGTTGRNLIVEETHEAQIVEAVLGNPNYTPGQPIRMVSCALDAEQAQSIANLTGSTVFRSPFVVGVVHVPPPVGPAIGGTPAVQFIRQDVATLKWTGQLDASTRGSQQVWNVFRPGP